VDSGNHRTILQRYVRILGVHGVQDALVPNLTLRCETDEAAYVRIGRVRPSSPPHCCRNGTLTLFTFPFSLSLQTLYLRALYIHPSQRSYASSLHRRPHHAVCARSLLISPPAAVLPLLFHTRKDSLAQPPQSASPLSHGAHIYDLYAQICPTGTLPQTTSICLLSVSVPPAWVA
jgi:hypothetical protein